MGTDRPRYSTAGSVTQEVVIRYLLIALFAERLSFNVLNGIDERPDEPVVGIFAGDLLGILMCLCLFMCTKQFLLKLTRNRDKNQRGRNRIRTCHFTDR
jgi:hypothetical protein